MRERPEAHLLAALRRATCRTPRPAAFRWVNSSADDGVPHAPLCRITRCTHYPPAQGVKYKRRWVEVTEATLSYAASRRELIAGEHAAVFRVRDLLWVRPEEGSDSKFTVCSCWQQIMGGTWPTSGQAGSVLLTGGPRAFIQHSSGEGSGEGNQHRGANPCASLALGDRPL
jgi:hypothetical protein